MRLHFLRHWVNSGVYVLGEDALALLPEKGDHEVSTFPQLARERRLHAHRHEGVWLTVNTPKDLRRAAEFVDASRVATAEARRVSVGSTRLVEERRRRLCRRRERK